MSQQQYRYETGPIRPPSEHASLLLRVTRNCPWNRCRFCTLYKGTTFSIRRKEDVMADLDAVRAFVDLFEKMSAGSCAEAERESRALTARLGAGGPEAFHSAAAWFRAGMKSVFLQDANTMLVKPDDLADILAYLRKLFLKSGASPPTAGPHHCPISDENLARLAGAGLNRIHVGMESGSDRIFALWTRAPTKRPTSRRKKVKARASSCRSITSPALGARNTRENALETADAMNK